MGRRRMGRIIICTNCDEEKKYYALDMCRRCYKADYREKNREQIRIYHREYLRCWRKKNPEKSKEYCRRWRENDPERANAMAQQYREKHREILCARTRRYRQENPDYYPNWWRNNPEKLAAQKARRRAHKQNVANTLTPEQTEFERKIGKAIYFGEKLHLHHIVPLSKGGGHTWGNVVFIPVSLNVSIRDKLPEEVYVQMGLEI